jgi:hypothetical protein
VKCIHSPTITHLILARNHLAAITSVDEIKSAVADVNCGLNNLNLSDNGFFEYVGQHAGLQVADASSPLASSTSSTLPQGQLIIEEIWGSCQVNLSDQEDNSRLSATILLIQRCWKNWRKKINERRGQRGS